MGCGALICRRFHLVEDGEEGEFETERCEDLQAVDADDRNNLYAPFAGNRLGNREDFRQKRCFFGWFASEKN